MELLPKSHEEFRSSEYWDRFFKKRGSKPFEWYGEYPELCGLLHKYVKTTDNVLVIGCGNSNLSSDMYDVGYHSITNVDISDVVIRQMLDKHSTDRPHMKWLKMDITDTSFADNEYSVVVDKGTLDALMTDESDAVNEEIDRMFAEIDRVLRLGGRYVCVSLLQDHILKKVLHYFPSIGWPVRIHRILGDVEREGDSGALFLPSFFLVFTKFKKMPTNLQILELSIAEAKTQRLPSAEKLASAIKEIQYYGVLKHKLRNSGVTDEQVTLSLYNTATDSVRYTLYVIDSPTKLVNKFAIFIVPQGRETEWLFSSDAGRQQLQTSSAFERLVVVTLHRTEIYENLEAIKAELSLKVMELSPPNLKTGAPVPFLSVGDDIGKRVIQFQGHSQFSGDFVVEDVETDSGTMYRRLVFLSNQNVIQSETRMRKVIERKKRKGARKKETISVDKSYLSCQHHVAMVGGLGLLPEAESRLASDFRVLVVGLGGGALSVFIHQHFPKSHVTAIELDPAIVDVASKWFGFEADHRLDVILGDGLDVIADHAQKGEKYDVIMLDVDCKDTSVGMTCPPQAFVEISFLETVRKILCDTGVFVVNLVCRNQELKKTVITNIKSVFPIIYSADIEEEINEVLHTFSSDSRPMELPPNLASVLTKITADMKKTSNTQESDFPDLADALENLHLA